MNHDDSKNETPSGGLDHRLDRLIQKVDERANVARRRHSIVLGVMATLGVLSIVGLSQITRLAHSLDTKTLAFMGRSELERRLPEGRQALEQHLKQQAPELVAAGLRAAIETAPHVRSRLVDLAGSQLDDLTAPFELRMIANMESVIHGLRDEIERTHPEATNKQELIAAAAAAEFRKNLAGALDELYPHYEAEMARIRQQLTRLMTTHPSQLTESELDRRQLIETMLQLVRRATTKPS